MNKEIYEKAWNVFHERNSYKCNKCPFNVIAGCDCHVLRLPDTRAVGGYSEQCGYGHHDDKYINIKNICDVAQYVFQNAVGRDKVELLNLGIGCSDVL